MLYGTEWGPSGVDALGTDGFAEWTRRIMGDVSGITFDGFDIGTRTLWAYEIVNPLNPSGPPDWRKDINWYYAVQYSNIHEWVGDVIDGTKLVYPWVPIADAYVTASIYSYDNDAAGVILRYQDPEHYYQVTVDEQRDRVQFSKREGNQYDILNTAPITFDWAGSNWHTVRVRAVENEFRVEVDGQFIMNADDADDDYRDGWAGIIVAGNEDTYIDEFLIQNF